MTASKLVLNAASGVGGAGLDVDDVFRTYVYTGNNTARTITNGIDLSGEGGLVWTKARDYAVGSALVDTVRGNTKYLESNSASGEASSSVGITAFNSTGYNLGADNTWVWNVNNSYVSKYVSWTFRKAPKFFDIVTYTGTSSPGTTVNHNLGSVPGMIIIKNISHGSSNWRVYHRGNHPSDPEDYALILNATNAQGDSDSYWNDTAPTSTQFTLGGDDDVNDFGDTYVAYLFAHNNNDGGFGPDADQDIIKCGSYTGDYPNKVTVNLGFEPQYILVKNATAASNWGIYDAMRGMPVGDSNSLVADTTGAENGVLGSGEAFEATATGFTVDSGLTAVNNASATHIYMAIRRGSLAEPDDATKVFAVAAGNSGSAAPLWQSNFAVDMALQRDVSSTTDMNISSRLTQGKFLKTNGDSGEGSQSNATFDFMDGWYNSYNFAAAYSWMWKRAPGFFDVVCYDGNGSVRTINHSLGVPPEMMWIKRRSGAVNWGVYYGDNTDRLILNTTGATGDFLAYWNDTSPTSSVFTLGDDNDVNGNGETYIAYLFATVAGVSKCGTYTGTGSSDINVDCGFSSGARFVLIKRLDANGSWWVADTVRGIASGNDSLLELNSDGAQVTSYNMVKPLSSGFIVNGGTGKDNSWNDSGGSYLFYAIA